MGTIYFTCPDNSSPSGGVRKIYEFAAALNRNGFDATVAHSQADFQAPDVDRSVPTCAGEDTSPQGGDLVVVPDVFGDRLPDWAPGVAKLVLNQGTFIGHDDHYTHREVVSIVTVSEHGRSFSSMAYPGKRVERIHLAMDHALFSPLVKRRQIAYMPRKGAKDITIVLNALRSRGSLDGWDVIEIHSVAITEVAETLGRSSHFFTASTREGFGLPPLEAMSAGCLVVGYHGQGGREYFDPAHCFPVPPDDLEAFVHRAEESLKLFDEEREAANEMAATARATARVTYTRSREEADVVRIFGEAMRAAGKFTSGPQRMMQEPRVSTVRRYLRPVKRFVAGL